MKELKLFESWADSISKSYVTEFVAPDKKKNSRALNTGIQNIAQRQYPDLDPQEALMTYMSKKLTDMDEKDAEQIKLINRQSQELSTQRNTIQAMRAAHDELERSAAETENEVEQIRTGATKTLATHADLADKAKQVQQIQAEIKSLRDKPGMTNDKMEELETQLKRATQDTELLNQYSVAIKKITDQKEVTDADFKKLLKQLNDKEHRFQDSLYKNASKFNEYAKKFQKYEKTITDKMKKIDDLKKQLDKNDALDNNQNDVLRKTLGDLKNMENFMGKAVIPKLKNIPDKQTIMGDEDYTAIAKTISALHNRLIRLEKKISLESNIPESYLNAIDTMAENILGEQYGKYLK